MSAQDRFNDIAPYYDAIMSHVDYERWVTVASALADLLPRGFLHLDAACGTGTLLKRLRRAGWHSVGCDLSPAMVRTGQRDYPRVPCAVADLRALPFTGVFDFATCLFDSVNFLLDTCDLEKAFAEISAALKEGGLFYFDVVTERMVTQHFAGQQWTESNGAFRTTWTSTYQPATATAETSVQVRNGPGCTILERIFPRETLERTLSRTGFQLLAVYDAEGWRAPRKRTIRIDLIAVKGRNPRVRAGLRKARACVRRELGWT